MKKIEKLTINIWDNNDTKITKQIINEIIDVVNNQCKDCSYIKPLKEVWDNPEEDKAWEHLNRKCSDCIFHDDYSSTKCCECSNGSNKEVWDTPEEDKAWKHLENKPFKVKIIKCSNDWWYNYKVGQEIFVKNTYDKDKYIDNENCWYLKQDCEIVEENPDWQKAVEEANNYNINPNNEDTVLYYNQCFVDEKIDKFQHAVSKLKQQLTENLAHSAGVINRLEAKVEQLKKMNSNLLNDKLYYQKKAKQNKSSQIKIDDDSIEWLECLSKGYYYHTEYHKQKADYILKQIRGE